MNQVVLNKSSIVELSNLVEEIQLWLESLELASNPEIMESLRKSQEQIKNRDFGSWDEL